MKYQIFTYITFVRARKERTATAVNMIVGINMMMEANTLVPKKTMVPNQPLQEHR